MMRSVTILILLTVALTACSKKEDASIRFDGQYFKTKAKKADDDLAEFTVTITPVSSSVAGALAAGEYEGTKYCIGNFGSSVIRWTVGPKTDPKQIQVVDNTLTLLGRCDP
jgi:hypothetical protein